MLFSVRLNNWFLGYYIIQTNRNLSSWATFKHKHQQCYLQSDSLHHIKLTLQSTKVLILCSGMILHWRSYSNQFKSFLLRCPWGLCPIKKLVTSTGMSKKDKMADGAHRRLCVSDGPASKSRFCAEGTGHFRSSGRQVGSRFGMNTNLLRGVVSPLYLHRMIV